MSRATTHLTASKIPPFHPRFEAVSPLSIKSTYFGKTSIEGEKNPLPEIDGHPHPNVTTLLHMLMREKR